MDKSLNISRVLQHDDLGCFLDEINELVVLGNEVSLSVVIYMLNQAAGDRQILADQLNISPHQLSYVTHSGEGEGLLFYGNVILPFVDRFPTDLELYRIMTTKLTEVKEAKEA